MRSTQLLSQRRPARFASVAPRCDASPKCPCRSCVNHRIEREAAQLGVTDYSGERRRPLRDFKEVL